MLLNINQFNGWKADCSKSGCCLSVCLPVSLSLHDCAPSDPLRCPPLLSFIIFSVQTAVRESPWLLSWDTTCAPPHCTTLPAPLLTQVIGVLISSDAVWQMGKRGGQSALLASDLFLYPSHVCAATNMCSCAGCISTCEHIFILKLQAQTMMHLNMVCMLAFLNLGLSTALTVNFDSNAKLKSQHEKKPGGKATSSSLTVCQRFREIQSAIEQ